VAASCLAARGSIVPCGPWQYPALRAVAVSYLAGRGSILHDVTDGFCSLNSLNNAANINRTHRLKFIASLEKSEPTIHLF